MNLVESIRKDLTILEGPMELVHNHFKPEQGNGPGKFMNLDDEWVSNILSRLERWGEEKPEHSYSNLCAQYGEQNVIDTIEDIADDWNRVYSSGDEGYTLGDMNRATWEVVNSLKGPRDGPWFYGN